MSRLNNWYKLAAVIGLLFAVIVPAWAYIDPGTASVIYTVGLGPVLVFLAWLGRRMIRIFIQSKKKASSEEEGGEESEA